MGRVDLFLIDEGSQIEDPIAERLFLALQELPHKPFVTIAADYQQLSPIAGGSKMWSWCMSMNSVELKTIFRTSDPALLDFLTTIRTTQPDKRTVAEFFHGRHLTCSLEEAVGYGLHLGDTHKQLFSWLCVTNKGAETINRAALSHLGITDEDLCTGYPGDWNVNSPAIVARVGIQIRLTRNLDKDRGFVNGAVGHIHVVLSPDVFIVKLTTGNLVLCHPVCAGDRTFLPCTYGYATTIRRAQGSSLHLGALYFDHSWPPMRGYGSVRAAHRWGGGAEHDHGLCWEMSVPWLRQRAALVSVPG